MPANTSRVDGLRSASPASPTPSNPAGTTVGISSKRYTSEAPHVSLNSIKRRRLVSLDKNRTSNGTSRLSQQSLDEDDGGGEMSEDELSLVQDATTTNTATITGMTTFSRPSMPTPKQSPAGPPLGPKITSLASHLLANPPRSAAGGSDAAEKAKQTRATLEQYHAVQVRLATAKAKLTEQLTVDVGTPHGTPPASASQPGSAAAAARAASIAADEDDAVASAMARIAGLESQRTALMEKMHRAQMDELEASQSQDTHRLTVQVEHARLFRRVVDLGPTGTAALFRVLLKAAGVVVPNNQDDPEEEDGGAAAAEEEGEGEGEEAQRWVEALKKAFEEDLAREGLMP